MCASSDQSSDSGLLGRSWSVPLTNNFSYFDHFLRHGIICMLEAGPTVLAESSALLRVSERLRAFAAL